MTSSVGIHPWLYDIAAPHLLFTNWIICWKISLLQFLTRMWAAQYLTASLIPFNPKNLVCTKFQKKPPDALCLSVDCCVYSKHSPKSKKWFLAGASLQWGVFWHFTAKWVHWYFVTANVGICKLIQLVWASEFNDDLSFYGWKLRFFFSAQHPLEPKSHRRDHPKITQKLKSPLATFHQMV